MWLFSSLQNVRTSESILTYAPPFADIMTVVAFSPKKPPPTSASSSSSSAPYYVPLGQADDLAQARRPRRCKIDLVSRCCSGGAPLSLLLLLLAVVACLAWMAGLFQLRQSDQSLSLHPADSLVTLTKAIKNSSEPPLQCSSVPVVYRFDCQPDPKLGERECLNRGCCWDPSPSRVALESEPLDVPYCFYPEGHSSYAFVNVTQMKGGSGASALYRLRSSSGYPKDSKFVRMDVVGETESRLRVKVRFLSNLPIGIGLGLLWLQIYDDEHARYEVPYLPDTSTADKEIDFGAGDHQYRVSLSDTDFGFRVMRGDGTVM